MPNQPVRCPNCGSGDARQTSPDSYVCEHCHTSFRWVDPTKTTVVQQPSLCRCGNIAAAFCTRCHEPLCEGHRYRHYDGPSRMDEDKYARSDQVRKLLGEYTHCIDRTLIVSCVESWGRLGSTRPEWVRDLLEQRGLDVSDETFPLSVLCGKCFSADWKMWGEVLGEVFTSFRQRIAKGLVCITCLTDQIVRHCPACGRGVCSRHGFECSKCHQHYCGHEPFGRELDSGKWVCTKCAKWWRFGF